MGCLTDSVGDGAHCGERDNQEAKDGPGLADRTKKQKRRRLEERLRVADPW